VSDHSRARQSCLSAQPAGTHRHSRSLLGPLSFEWFYLLDLGIRRHGPVSTCPCLSVRPTPKPSISFRRDGVIQLSVRSRRCGADAVKTVVRSLHWGSTTSWVLLLVRSLRRGHDSEGAEHLPVSTKGTCVPPTWVWFVRQCTPIQRRSSETTGARELPVAGAALGGKDGPVTPCLDS
jgi:hypothetical protein